MATNTQQNEAGLKPLTDLTRWVSIVLLLLHFYVECYGFFKLHGWAHPIGNRILDNIHKTGLFNNFNKAKLVALAFLVFSLFGAQQRKGEKFKYRPAIIGLLTGLVLYFASALLFLYAMDINKLAVSYMSVTTLGYLLVMSGGAQLARILTIKINGEVFNTENETFPQEERKLENKYSVNLPTHYRLKDRQRSGWINIINGFRGGILLMGLPGSGKTLIAKEMLKQQIAKGFAMFIHDFKYPDLTTVAYNHYLLQRRFYKVPPTFHILNFENIQERCNPLLPGSLHAITDAASASRAILLGLNQEWIERQGDFWIESSVNFVTALIWFLRVYENGKYCTLPHVIELAQTPLDKLLSILQAESGLEVLVMPFVRAYEEDAGKQLIGQISGAAWTYPNKWETDLRRKKLNLFQMKTRLFTEEFKKKAVELSVSRGTVKDVAEELGIRAELLSKWRNNPLYNGGYLLADNSKLSEEQLKIRRLEKELREIKQESEILKKALGIFSRNERSITNL